MERRGFVFYRSFIEAAQELDDDLRLEFYDAIAGYGLDGVMPSSPSPIISVMLKMAIPQIDANNKRYEEGGQGGRPSKKKLPCSKETFLTLKEIPEEWEDVPFPKAWNKERLARQMSK